MVTEVIRQLIRAIFSRYFATRLGHLIEVARVSCGMGRYLQQVPLP